MNELRIGNVITLAGVTIIPVEELTIIREINPITKWWYGSKNVYAVVVVSTTFGTQVLDKNARELNVLDLISQVPRLAEMLDLGSG
ncbi:hypothetical protein AC478_00610 [miscellaneous Crenarchaeota group-1 archaeon SG8-32-3]|uniref:Uncharacterized protein n=1 Tax=miscellaneous Crenarchaeota group-1 archaeon SG8-32-3 TaxID=1685125 RepID=A0A0M0BVV7_9ARCH|nr:MAG: hypothetical protein AC478_00610 [miscellaneous Crenarchaeota group-1 archaeon SG8-32-3]